jgi:hypothetical protein
MVDKHVHKALARPLRGIRSRWYAGVRAGIEMMQTG